METTVKFKGTLDKEQLNKFTDFLAWYKEDYEKKHPGEKTEPTICTKPDCDCLERAEEANNGQEVKSYPCLAGADQRKAQLIDATQRLAEGKCRICGQSLCAVGSPDNRYCPQCDDISKEPIPPSIQAIKESKLI